MTYKKLLCLPIAATLLLTACGDDDSGGSGDPAKIEGKQPQQTQKSNNKDSSKEQKGDAKTSSKKSDKKDPSKTDDQVTEKNSESGNDILAEGEKK